MPSRAVAVDELYARAKMLDVFGAATPAGRSDHLRPLGKGIFRHMAADESGYPRDQQTHTIHSTQMACRA